MSVDHIKIPDDYPYNRCMAGELAFFGGAWKGKPCDQSQIVLTGRVHMIGSPGLQRPIQLCDTHFMEVQTAGLVEEPYLTMDEMLRKMRE